MKTRSRSHPPLAPGTAPAAGYEVIAHLSRAEAYDVYDVWSTQRLSRCVAKVVRPDRRDEEGHRHRLVREGELLSAYCHPHLVRAYETLFVPGPVVILETLTGATLSHLIHTHNQPLAIGDLAVLGVHLCSAIYYIHANGYLHRDLKPSNIVVQGGLAKVIDLGMGIPSASRSGEGHAPTWPLSSSATTPPSAPPLTPGGSGRLCTTRQWAGPPSFRQTRDPLTRTSLPKAPAAEALFEEEYYEEDEEYVELNPEELGLKHLQLENRAPSLGSVRSDLPEAFAETEPAGRPGLLALAVHLAELAPSGSVPLDALRRTAEGSP